MNAIAFDAILAKSTQLLGAVLHDVEKVALLDYPEYANVGDSMIWLGQIALLRKLKKKIVYVCAISNYDENVVAEVVANGAALMINGGGNFGTLWPHHQLFRERIMARFSSALIVQMPQSICFENDAALARTRAVIAQCSNLHLLARDYPSLAFARQHFCSAHVELCPDSAFFLADLTAPPPQTDVLYLRRSDREAGVTEAAITATEPVAVTDWLQQDISERWLQKAIRFGFRCGWLSNSQRFTQRLYDWLADLRVRRGIRLIASGRYVITDRLHAHVLSVLLNRPSVLLDNSNGKVFAFHDAWTRELGLARTATSLREALRMVGAMHLLPVFASQFLIENDFVDFVAMVVSRCL